MNDISTILTRCEKSLRDASEAICRPDMREQDEKMLAVSLTSIWALAQDGLDWLSKRSEAPNRIGQPDETRSVREEVLKPDWSRKHPQLATDIQTWRKQLFELQRLGEKIEDQLLRSQTPIPPYVYAKQDNQPDIDRALQDIRERAEAETKRTTTVPASQLHVASRSSKVY